MRWMHQYVANRDCLRLFPPITGSRKLSGRELQTDEPIADNTWFTSSLSRLIFAVAFFFFIWGDTRSLCMRALRPAFCCSISDKFYKLHTNNFSTSHKLFAPQCCSTHFTPPPNAGLALILLLVLEALGCWGVTCVVNESSALGIPPSPPLPDSYFCGDEYDGALASENKLWCRKLHLVYT